MADVLQKHEKSSADMPPEIALCIVVIAIVLCWWIWPLGPAVVCASTAALAGLFYRSHKKARFLWGVASIAFWPLLVQVIIHGRPAVWWLIAVAVGAGMCHGARSTLRPMMRIMVTNVRNSAIASGVGLAGVLALQVVLAYSDDGQLSLVQNWTRQLANAHDVLARIVLMDPWSLVAVLVSLIALAILVPSLHVVRNYRWVALVTSRAFLAVTVAASFGFFGSQYVQTRWIARMISDARGQLGAIEREIEDSNRRIVELAAIEDIIRDSSPHSELTALGRALAEQPHDANQELVGRVAKEIAYNVPVGLLNERMDFVVKHATEVAVSPGLREHRAIVERVRRDCDRGVPPDPTDLTALELERTRSRAARDEARAATRVFLTNTLAQVIPGGPLVNALAVQLVTRVDGMYQGRADLNDRGRASAAVHAAPHPPRVYFDLTRITSTGSTTSSPTATARGAAASVSVNGAIAPLLDTGQRQIAEERRKEAERAQVAREAEPRAVSKPPPSTGTYVRSCT